MRTYHFIIDHVQLVHVRARSFFAAVGVVTQQHPKAVITYC